MTIALRADRSFARVLIKNPLSDEWNVITNDIRCERRKLADFVSHVKLAPRLPGDSNPANGRNCALFARLRQWVASMIGTFDGFGSRLGCCNHAAADFNAEFETPLPTAEVR